MEEYKHIITGAELVAHPDAFPDDAIAGMEVVLTEEQYEILGVQLHAITQADIAEDESLTERGLVEGDIIEIVAEGKESATE